MFFRRHLGSSACKMMYFRRMYFALVLSVYKTPKTRLSDDKTYVSNDIVPSDISTSKKYFRKTRPNLLIEPKFKLFFIGSLRHQFFKLVRDKNNVLCMAETTEKIVCDPYDIISSCVGSGKNVIFRL